MLLARSSSLYVCFTKRLLSRPNTEYCSLRIHQNLPVRYSVTQTLDGPLWLLSSQSRSPHGQWEESQEAQQFNQTDHIPSWWGTDGSLPQGPPLFLEKLLGQKVSEPLSNSSKDPLSAFSTTQLSDWHPNWELNVSLLFSGVYSKTQNQFRLFGLRKTMYPSTFLVF